MPIYWRYLLVYYLKILILCVLSFIAMLLTMRLDEIAHFATLGPSLLDVSWFAFQQIPYILPIALPVSALIAALLLMSNLSHSGELTALRAAGLSLASLFAPLLLMGAFLSIINFFVISEISTATHLNTGLSKSQLRAINPLLLMSSKHVMKLKGFYFDVRGPSRVGEFVQDFVFVSPNKRTNRVNLMLAKKLQVQQGYLLGDQVTFLTEQNGGEAIQGQLLIENIEHMQTQISDFSNLMDKKSLSLNNDHLSFVQLLVRQKELQARLKLLGESVSPFVATAVKESKEQLQALWSEMMRRGSVGFSVLSFTFLGLAFGIQVSRKKRGWGLVSLICLAALFLVGFFIAKSFENKFTIASLLYIFPHILIWISSCYAVTRVSRGVA